MQWVGKAWRRLTFFFRRGQFQRELREEMDDHEQMKQKDLAGEGMPPDEARNIARRDFGNALLLREKSRDAWGFHWLETLLQDIRYGVRQLRRNPAFAAVIVVTLALTIGANATIFSLLNALLLRQLPVRQPAQLVDIWTRDRTGGTGPLSFPLFKEVEQRQRVFSGLSGWEGGGVVNVEANGVLSRRDVYRVTGNFYSVLGVKPLLGRLLMTRDVNLHASSPAVAVLSYDFWRQYYSDEWTVVGKTVRVEGVPFTIIGVTQAEFKGLVLGSEPDVTIPLTAALTSGWGPEKILKDSDLWLYVTGRLRNGVTLDEARAQIASFWQYALAATLPPDYKAKQRGDYLATRSDLKSGSNGISWYLRPTFTRPLYILTVIAGLILLAACVNIASLMLVRTVARSHEIGVRIALGATRARLVRQLLTESLLLSAVGAAAGFALARWGSVKLKDFVTNGYLTPVSLTVKPDLRVLGFVTGLAVLTAILFGMAPVWITARRRPSESLEENSRTTGSSAGRFGKVLISGQVAISLVLVMAAGLFTRSLEKLNSVDPGFQAQRVLDLQLFPRPRGYEKLDNRAYYSDLIRRVLELPGVSGAAISHDPPLWGFEQRKVVSPGSPPSANGMRADIDWVSPGFFDTLSIPVFRGRDFTWQDNVHSTHVAIISRSLAHRLFPNSNATSQKINVGTDPKWQNVRVIGIVGDARLYDIRSPNTFAVYESALQAGLLQEGSLDVRAEGSPTALAEAVRKVVNLRGREDVLTARSLRQVEARSLLDEHLTAMLSEAFGVLALLLIAIGLYGLMAYSVAQRTREIGVRMALGAQRHAILRMIMRETLATVMTGLMIGIPCALAASRLVRHMLFGLSPGDPLTLAAVSIVLICVASVAGYIPARRAANVDPMVALRHE
jgi:predicted permease